MRNTSPEPITIIGVTDAIEGGDPFDVTAAGGPVLATTCGDAVGTVLAPDGSYSCSFTVLVSGDGGDIIDDEVTVTATDDDGNEIGAVAPESVVVDDVSPTATATKTASADAVAEPGDEVAFTASLTNTSPEAVTITGLTDAVDGGAPFDATRGGRTRPEHDLRRRRRHRARYRRDLHLRVHPLRRR